MPILFHINPATVLLFNGIGTLLYLFICKGKIPAYLGSSFAFLSPRCCCCCRWATKWRWAALLQRRAVLPRLPLLSKSRYRLAGCDVPPAAMGAIVAVIGLELAGRGG
ncbi:hypothetical protein LN650_08925 [Klebsiella pneumoniae subsp. pneumoniae]|nr:hypothetical protein [Klebsiella pneumoniae subsp. pneumoniae]